MKYETTKKQIMDDYPELFVDETDVLEHLFAVNGNGYEWKKGQLVSKFDDFKSSNFNVPNNPEIVRQEALKRRVELIGKYGSTVWSVLPDGSFNKKIYPICKYAKIMNIPSDIKKDWLNAAKRAIEIFFSPRFNLTDEDRKQLLKVKEQLEKV